MTVRHQIAEMVAGGELLGIMTALFLLAFIGWTVWAWAPRNREAMERYGRIPLDDGDADADR